ncbi:MAG: RNA 3'-terminal phosphate cyclase [bacterium]|nr:RNA 3'-terminal phosphate cyclase [bacterium]
MILIDGVLGEGGGQILRTSLGLSLYTGQPFRINNIRAGRRKPGLLRQHLTAVKAAREISDARVEGAELKSCELEFIPGSIKPGSYRFAVGTAGSATLVCQTILPAFLTGEAENGEIAVTIEGGTHNMMAPPFDFLQKTFFGVLNKMGAKVSAELKMHGFYPAGGGCFEVKAEPVSLLQPLELPERGEIIRQGADCLSSHLPKRIIRQESEIVAERMKWPQGYCRYKEVKSPGPGNIVMIYVESEAVNQVFTAFGQKGVALQTVADAAVDQAKEYLSHNLVVDKYLADQLLLPMAMAGKGKFVTGKPTLHTETNIAVIKRFLDIGITTRQIDEHRYQIEIG